MSRGRTFSREVKLAVMPPLASGAKRPAQLCREHGLANSVLARWRHAYAERGEAAFTPREPDDAEPVHRRIAEWERCRGPRARENQARNTGLGSMAALPAAFPALAVRRRCALLGRGRRWWYDRAPPREPDAAAVAPRAAIERSVLDSPGDVTRRVMHALRRAGWDGKAKRVLRVPREDQLPRRFVVTTDARPGFPG